MQGSTLLVAKSLRKMGKGRCLSEIQEKACMRWPRNQSKIVIRDEGRERKKIRTQVCVHARLSDTPLCMCVNEFENAELSIIKFLGA